MFMAFGVIFEDKRQTSFVLLEVVHIYVEYALEVVRIYLEWIQYISIPTPMRVLGHAFPLAILPWSIITDQVRGRKWIKVIWEFFTQSSLAFSQ